MNKVINSKVLRQFLVLVAVFLGLTVGHAQAKMIPTSYMISSDGEQYSQQQLQTALASDELKQQLQDMGVDPKQLNDRIASLTPDEIQQLNTKLEAQPAGGIIGVLATIFIVLIVTDMLCATDVFTFVRCINK